MTKRKKIVLSIIAAMVAGQVFLLSALFYMNRPVERKITFCATFSSWHARYFGLDAGSVLDAALKDLQIKNYRIPVYWNVAEANRGKYDFSDIDWQLDKIEKEGGAVILAIGRRLPRWPECHIPNWAANLKEIEQQKLILKMLTAAVDHFKNRQSIEAWQVENEPTLEGYGECPAPNTTFLKEEVGLVRSLDSRPIIITESGELSTWLTAAKLADKIGISIYRTVWNRIVGFISYPLVPAYYRYHAKILAPFVQKIFVVELQVEPWAHTTLIQMPKEAQKTIMNERKAKQAIEFAKQAGFKEIYLWGLEWWAYLKTNGDSGMWQTIKDEVAKNI